MKSFIAGIKKAAVQAKGKLAIVGAAAGAGALMLPGISHAELSAPEQAMVTSVVTKLTDMATMVSTFATANLGIISTMVVAALIFYYVKSAGK